MRVEGGCGDGGVYISTSPEERTDNFSTHNEKCEIIKRFNIWCIIIFSTHLIN